MLSSALAWLSAGQPPHYLYLLAGLYALAEYLLPRTQSVAARSFLEAMANALRLVPGVGALFERFGTPRPASAAQSTGSGTGALLGVLLLSLSAGGCAAFRAQPVALQKAEASALKCGLDAVQTSMQQLSPAVLDALAGDSPDWRAQFAKLEATGTSALLCSVAHSLYDALGADVTVLAEADLEHRILHRLAIADAGGGVPLPTPTRRVLARGLGYLRERGVFRAPASAPSASP